MRRIMIVAAGLGLLMAGMPGESAAQGSSASRDKKLGTVKTQTVKKTPGSRAPGKSGYDLAPAKKL
jgi:hypothetical protein